MYEYQYKSIETDGGFFSSSWEHREVIDSCAAQGWRYVGFFPTVFTSRGGISHVDLVFEREKAEE